MSHEHTTTTPPRSAGGAWRVVSTHVTEAGEFCCRRETSLDRDVQRFRYGQHLCEQNHGGGGACLCESRPRDVRATTTAFNRLIAVTAKLAALHEPSLHHPERINVQRELDAAIKRQLRPLSPPVLAPSFALLRNNRRSSSSKVAVTLSDSEDNALARQKRRFVK